MVRKATNVIATGYGLYKTESAFPADPERELPQAVLSNTQNQCLNEENDRIIDSLRQSEERLNLALQGADLGMWDWDIETGKVVFNDRWAEMLGYSTDEIEPHVSSWEKLLHPDDVPSVTKVLTAHLEGKSPFYETEHRLRTKSGGWKWILDKGKVTKRDEKGRPLRAVGTHLDITERMRMIDLSLIQRDLAFSLSSASDLHVALENVLEGVMKFEAIDCGGIYLADKSGGLTLVVNKGLLPEFIESAKYFGPASAQARLVMAAKAVYKPYKEVLPNEENEVRRQQGLRGIAIIPILHKEQIVAVMNVASRNCDEIPEHVRNALESIAAQIGSAIVRIRTEDRLRESRKNLESLFNTLNDFLFVADTQGQIIECNLAVEKQLGYSHEELRMMNLLDVHPEEMRDDAMHIIADMLEGKRTYCPIPLRTITGTLIPVETKVAKGTWDGKDVLFGISRDITERMEAEAALQRSEESLRTLLESAPVGIVTIDPISHTIESVNAMAASMIGITPEKIIGRICHQFLCPAQTGACPITDLGKHVENEQRSLIRSDGQVLPVLKTVRKVEIKGTERLIECFVDLSERMCMEEEIKTKTKELEITNQELKYAIDQANHMAIKADFANRTKSQFLANMSHEIRTPLNGVMGMTNLLLETTLTQEQHGYAQIIRSSGESLLSLIDDILDFSKIEAKKLDLEIINLDLRTITEDVTEILALRAHEKNLELTCLLSPELPVLVRGDPGRLRQILINLIGNAIKFTHAGEVIISAEKEGEDNQSMTVRFTVEDTGIGIPANRLDAIFSPFEQADGSTTRKYGGTGLGLAICRHLVKMMEGVIGVESKEGKGSSFWFTVRFEKQKDMTQPLQKTCTALPNQKVLVVDSHKTTRKFITDFLHSWGCRYNEFDDSKKAFIALKEAFRCGDPYKTAFIDLRENGIDGNMLARSIKTDPDLQDICLIAMNVLRNQNNSSTLDRSLFSDCLFKPIRSELLFASLVRTMGIEKNQELTLRNALNRSPILDPVKGQSHILLVEDTQTNQAVALSMLRKLGYMVDLAMNGNEALALLRDKPYNLVLMDCQMPEMDGYEAARRIRKGEVEADNSNIPIIAMTANAMKEDREKCFKAGMNDYISKPYSMSILSDTLGRWLLRSQETHHDTAQNKETQKSINNIALTHKTTDSDSLPGDGNSNPVIFDRDTLLKRLMGDEDLMGTIIEGFLVDIPEQIRLLRDAVHNGVIHAVIEQAHKIKGAAGNISAFALQKAAHSIEVAGEKVDLKSLKSLLTELELQFSQLKECIGSTESCRS